jgi:Prolyl oligopeptidase, N-terminal beta-propeller domain
LTAANPSGRVALLVPLDQGATMRAKGILGAFASMLVLFGVQFGGLRAQSAPASFPASPPAAPVKPVTDDYFGTKVVDPYRYMENLKDPEVQAWFKAEDDYTRTVLAEIPGRRQLLDRIKQLDQGAPYHVANVERYQGDRYYYEKR